MVQSIQAWRRRRLRSVFRWSGLGIAFCSVLPGVSGQDIVREGPSILATGEISGPVSGLEQRTAQLLDSVRVGDMSAHEIWKSAQVLMDAWEASTELDIARGAYLSILVELLEVNRNGMEPIQDPALMKYLERGLAISGGVPEAGLLKLGLAEVILGRPDLSGQWARADALLEEALSLLPERAPKDWAYALRCRHYLDGAEAVLKATLTGVPVPVTKAVRLLSALLEIETADSTVLMAARESLDRLKASEISVSAKIQVAPFEALRIPVKVRNLSKVEAQLFALPLLGEGEFVPIEKRLSEPLDDVLPIVKQSHESAAQRYDWDEFYLEYQGGLAPGLYVLDVNGEALRERELVLVSDLELVILNLDKRLLAQVYTLKTGMSVEAAEVALFSAAEETVRVQQTNPDGEVEFEFEDTPKVAEMQVRSGDQFAIYRFEVKESTTFEETDFEMLVYPLLVRPNDSLDWFIFSDADYTAPCLLEFPDGQMRLDGPDQTGAGWTSGRLSVPDSVRRSGLIYAHQPDGSRRAVAYLKHTEALALDIGFLGESLHSDVAVIENSNFGGVRIRVSDAGVSLPNYLRVEVRPIMRREQLQSDDYSAVERGRPHVEVVSLKEDGPTEVYLEGMPVPDRLTVYEVSLSGLDSTELLGSGFFALTPFREVMAVEGREKLVRMGESLELKVQRPWGLESLSGEWVVFRETWRSQYIHRKRGTLISEDAYLELPERSLLGTAKTDYEIYEEGFVREEVQRFPVEIGSRGESVTVSFSQPGYYKIEFVPRDASIQVQYPSGPVETWVIGSKEDLVVFRSDRPRLIAERSKDGDVEVLVVLDRPQSKVLLFDGEFRRLDSGESAAVFTVLPEVGASAILEAVLIGERFSGRLAATVVDPFASTDWLSLDVEQFIGLRPGEPINWQVTGAEKNTPLWWAVLPGTPFADLEQWAAPAFPVVAQDVQLMRSSSGAVSAADDAGLDPDDEAAYGTLLPARFFALYPELILKNSGPTFRPQILDQKSPYPEPRALTGALPEASGVWNLLVFGLESGVLKKKTWRISTELPIAADFSGPTELRVGDNVCLTVEFENNLEEARRMALDAFVTEELELTGLVPSYLQLPPERRVGLNLEIEALRQGSGRAGVKLVDGKADTEAMYSMSVLEAPTEQAWGIRLYSANEGERLQDVSISEAERAFFAIGSGNLLGPLWDVLRSEAGSDNALMIALGDWAKEQVLTYHGRLLPNDILDTADILSLVLDEHAVEGKGWSYLPGGESSLRLSLLIVATLELSSSEGQQLLQRHLDKGLAFMEQQLLLRDAPRADRVDALHALSIRPARAIDQGPTRLEARSFLDLFHDRDALSLKHCARLLRIAQNFEFDEEVAILYALLLQRLDAEFWEALSLSEKSFLHYVLMANGAPSELCSRILADIINGLSNDLRVTGWEQIGAFLYLCTDYYWRGDFDLDGSFSYQLRGSSDTQLGEAVRCFARDGVHSLNLVGQSAELLTIDFTDLEGDLFLMTNGTVDPDNKCPRLAGGTVGFKRLYEEKTLLRGSIQKRSLIERSDFSIRVGDDLFQALGLKELSPGEPIEIEIPIPTGVSFDRSRFRLMDGTGAFWSRWNLDYAKADKLIKVRAIVPGDGNLKIELGMQGEWVGQYRWPASKLYKRLTGECFRLGDSLRLKIEPPITVREGE